MTNERHACADGLTPECFKKYPDWAKMRFALKLMSTLFPADITKRLPQVILDAMEQMPPDWPADQALPPALSLVPPAGIIVPAGGVIAPMYATPFSPGPPQVPGGNKAPAETEPWLYDKFTTLDTTFWTDASSGGGTCTIDTGRLKQYAPLPFGSAYIYSPEDATIPATFEWTFDLTYDTDLGGTFRMDVFTGAHQLVLMFDPTNQVKSYLDAGWTAWTVDNFLGTTESWKLVYDGTLITLYRGATAIFTDEIPYVDTSSAGLVMVKTTPSTIYLDELKIEEV